MPQLRFLKGNRPAIEVAKGDNLMRALLRAGIPVASSCHGDGVCGKCLLRVSEGAENLSAPNETEIFLKERLGLVGRISCQAEVLGDVTVDASYW